MMGQAHLSSCDKVGESMAAFGTRESECYCDCCTICWTNISFIHFKRGSIIEGTRKGLIQGNLVEQLVALLVPLRLVRS